MRTTSTVGLAEVAARAGVSKATASKVFNGRSDVADDTRVRVTAAAGELGYRPPAWQPPKLGPQLWVAITTLQNPYAGTLLDGLLAESDALGALVVVGQWSRESPAPAPRGGTPAWMRRGLDHRADGFILVTTPVTDEHLRIARSRDLPVVVVDPMGPVPEGALSVGSTNWRGGVQATEHLLHLGHRRIACVGVPAESTPGIERLAGYRSALDAAGVPNDPSLIRNGHYLFADGLALRSLLEGPDRPTAVFAANDQVACGVLEAARLAGLSVPGDLSVVGFDDTLTASVTAPPLTTVRQPLANMGQLAARACINALRGTTPIGSDVQLATTLVVRGSTGPAPGR